MSRSDASIRYTLYASLVVHASLCSWAVLTELRHFRHYLPPLRQPYEFAGAFNAIPADALIPIASLPPDLFPPVPPPEELPPKEIPEPPSLQDSRFGAADGAGYAINASPGDQYMKSRHGEQDQAWLSRDPEGPNRRMPDLPSESVALPGTGGAGGSRGSRGSAGSSGSSGGEEAPERLSRSTPRPGQVLVRPMPSPPPLKPSDAEPDAPLGVSNPPVATVPMKLNLPEHIRRIWIIPAIPPPPSPVPVASAPPLAPPAIAEPIAVGPNDPSPDPRRGADTRPAVARAPSAGDFTLIDRASPDRPDVVEGPKAPGQPLPRPPIVVLVPPNTSTSEEATKIVEPTTRPTLADSAPTTRPTLAAVVVAAGLADGVLSSAPVPDSVSDQRPMQSPSKGQATDPRSTTDVPPENISPAALVPQPPAQSPHPAPPEPSLTRSASARSSPAVPSSPGAPGAPGIPGPPVAPADAAPMSESESDPFSRVGSITFRPGRVDARFGRAHKLVKPRLTTAGHVDLMSIINPRIVFKVTIDATGKVIDVDEVSGNCTNEIRQPTILALYQSWFEPARDKAGHPLGDVLVFSVSWR